MRWRWLGLFNVDLQILHRGVIVSGVGASGGGSSWCGGRVVVVLLSYSESFTLLVTGAIVWYWRCSAA